MSAFTPGSALASSACFPRPTARRRSPGAAPSPRLEPARRPRPDTDDDVRCSCGALIARWVPAGLELKCRRCKCTTLVPYPARTSRYVKARRASRFTLSPGPRTRQV